MSKRNLRRAASVWFAVLLLLSSLQLYVPAHAAELPSTTFGQVVDMRQVELAPGATYTWYDMNIDRGKEKVHFVEFDPRNPNLELQAGTKSGKVYGMQGVTEMANHADKPGNRVITGINGDFYDLTGYSTGVPNGLFMDDGRILNSASSSFAFGLKQDGSSIYGTPKLTKTVAIGGATMNLTHINRYRENNQLVLYTPDYYTSTMTTNLGDEVVLDVLEGEVKSGQTMKLRVSEIHKDQGNAALEPGKVVLSAAGTAREALSELQIGDEVTASFALDAPWHDVVVAIGGQGPLIKDGVVQTTVGPAGVHPRTAIGTKADGSVVLFEIDGRAPGFSEGVETVELANIMKDIGVVNAMNLDGGGSSTFVAKLPGETAAKMLNRGSDGGERKTGNGLLLVNKAAEGPAAKLVVRPGFERILAGSSAAFQAAAVDEGGHPADYSGSVAWQADASVGTIDANGTFTAGAQGGFGVIRAAAGSLQGEAEVEIVSELTELQFPDEVKTFNSGATSVLSVTALRDGQVIQASNESFEWRVEGPIGTVDADGTFRATTANDQSGKIYVRHGNVETSMTVHVGVPPVVLEDFENGIGNYMASGAAYNTVTIDLQNDQDFVRFGESSLKLSYDFVGKTGTSGAYLQAKSAATRISVPGYPEKIGMWVYGDGEGHWLRAQMRDGNNAAFAIDFTDQTSGVNWTGWKYIEASMPKGKATPLTIDLPVRYMETNNAKKTAGALYIDQIRAVYGPLSEDTTPPLFKSVYPEPGAVVNTNTPQIYAIGEDAGYDPAKHPGTTLIDPNKIRVYIDGQQVTHGLYPPEGRITYKPAVPLDDGIHRVKMAIRDMSGNQTIKEWDFEVDTGMAKFRYATPEEVYAGHTYSVDVRGERVAELQGGHVEFAFDPSKVSDLTVVKNDKLSDAQVQPQVDAASGIVRVTFSDLDSAAGLTESDILAGIRYKVKGDASGANAIAFRSSSLLLKGASEPKNYVGAPLQSAIKQELRLQWDDNYGQGMTTTFTVTDEAGAPVQGAMLLANGAEVGDGSLRTDAQGKLSTDLLTKTVSSYRIQAAKGEQFSPIGEFKVSKLAGSAAPYNINVTMGEDPAASRGFTWHTHPDTDKSVVEIVKAPAAGAADFQASDAVRIEGTSYVFNTLDIGTIRVHKAVVDRLEPGTAYAYRVGDGEGNTSAEGRFVTAPLTGDQAEFLVFGDSQASDAAGFKIWGNTLKQAMQERPDAEFIVHVGDMVDNGFKEQEWNWWFAEAQPQLMQTTAVTLVGNHEVTGTKGNGDFLAHFNHPQNGAASQKGTNYSFDYKNMHIVVLNSEYVAGSGQTEWLRSDLAQTDKPWKIVFFHRGPYGSIYDTENVRNEWTPIFDEFGVDLVMNGHDHIYVRTHPMKNKQRAEDGQGTTYIIPGSTGPKFYDLTPRPWQLVTDDEKTQMYSSVQVNGDELKVVTKTVGGRVVDTFEVAKRDPLASIELTGKSSLKPGQTDTVVTEAVYESGKRAALTAGVTYESSAPIVATIDESGTVRALSPGETVISAKYGNKSASYKLTVLQDEGEPVLTGIAMDGPKTMQVGDTGTAVTHAVYSDGSSYPLRKGVAYDSSVRSVATIDDMGGIRAVGAGETVISATYGSMNASYKLTVWKEEEPKPEPVLTGIEIDGPKTMKIGETGAAKVTAVYEDGSRKPLTEGIAYDSGARSVATIDEMGGIRAVGAGETVIAAKYGNRSASYKLTVSVAEEKPALTEIEIEGPDMMRVGDTGTVKATAVYEDGSRQLLTEGVSFESSMPSVATVDEAGSIRAVGSGLAEITANYEDKTASYTLSVSARSRSGSRSGSVTPPAPDTPSTPQEPERKSGQVIVSEETLKGTGESGRIALRIDERLSEIVLPGNAAELLSGKALQVQADNLSMTIPASILEAVAGLVDTDLRNGSTIRFGVATLSAAEASGLLTNAGRLENAGIRAAGDVLEFRLTITTEEGSVLALDQFDEPLAISLPLSLAAREELVGIYRIADVGSIEYAAGQSSDDGMITASIDRFGRYAALEYDKTFADVEPDHWAVGTIKALAAKHLIEGVALDRFEPERTVTRAEFTAMLVRLLGLEGGQAAEPSAFTDVAAGEWYADAIALAHQAGIVDGIGDAQFAPNAQIKRQEMAAMLMRAYEHAAGANAAAGSGTDTPFADLAGAAAGANAAANAEAGADSPIADMAGAALGASAAANAGAGSDAPFADMADAPEWAREAVGAAAALGLLNGRSDTAFVPEGSGTRAESAQIIYNLLKAMN